MFTLLIGLLLFGLVGTILYKKVKRHQKGETGCGCCSVCPSSKSCSSHK